MRIERLNIDFMGRRMLAMILSITLIVISIGSLATRSLNFGIDFTGGYLVDVGYEEPVELADVQQILKDSDINDAIVQHFGSTKDVLIRLPLGTQISGAHTDNDDASKVTNAVFDLLKRQNENVQLRRSEFVGPVVGEELKNDGGLAMLIALMCIMIYVMIRFEWKFSVGAVIALAHDVIITLGVFSVVQAEFNLPTLAAILAVIGYSLNDTIVVYDRIRENFRRVRKGTSSDIMNDSINQTLSRTLMTSFTTMLVLLSLFFLGGEIIHSFSLALIVGIFVGTYSSIWVASPIVLALGLTREDMLVTKKEDAGLDHLP